MLQLLCVYFIGLLVDKISLLLDKIYILFMIELSLVKLPFVLPLTGKAFPSPQVEEISR